MDICDHDRQFPRFPRLQFIRSVGEGFGRFILGPSLHFGQWQQQVVAVPTALDAFVYFIGLPEAVKVGHPALALEMARLLAE